MSGGTRLLTAVSVLLIFSTNAHAILNQTQNGQAVNTSALTPASQTCDQTCNNLVSTSSGQIVGLGGSDGWSAADDQWCANHNAQTNPGVLASPVPTASGSPSCNIPMLQGDTSCAQVNQMYTHCQLHGTQLETQCLAYVQTKGASSADKTALGFDVTATGVCVTACIAQYNVFSSGAATALMKACSAAGTAASGAELIGLLASQGSASGKVISALGSGIGLAQGLNGLAQWAGKGGGIPSQGTKTAKREACAAAATFGAMTGIRSYSISQENKTKQNACNAVNQLASNVFSNSVAQTNPGFGGSSTSGGGSGATTGAPVQTNGFTTGSAARTNAVLLGDGSGFCGGGQPSASSCLSALNPSSGNSQAATDGGLLTTSGLAQQLAPQVAALPMDQMMRHLDNGGSADQLVQAALKGGGGDFGNAVAALAKAAQLDAPSLSGSLAMATPVSASGMLSNNAKTGSEEGGFKLMGQNDGNLSGVQGTTFGKGPALNGAEIGSDGDIYHSHFSGSIFDIVSHKITQTRDRVDDVGFSIPLNRALAGQR